MTTAGETQLDPGVLGRWLDANDAPGSGEEPLLEQLKGGSQNTLYLIARGSERMVLRMPGARADAARIDGLLREIRLVRALSGTDVPHAELIAADDSGTVLGMPFYVMRAIDGWSPMDGGWEPPFDTDLDARRGLAFELVEGAAKLGRVDWRGQGLEGFGRPDGFHDRQVDRWLAFLDSYKVRELPGLDEAADWLRRNRPAQYTAGHHARRLSVRQRDVRARRPGSAGRDRGLGDDDGRRSAAGPGLGAAGLRRRKPQRRRVLSGHEGDADAQRITGSLREGQRAVHREHRLLPGAGQLETRHRAGKDLRCRRADRKGRPEDPRRLRGDDPAADRDGGRAGA